MTDDQNKVQEKLRHWVETGIKPDFTTQNLPLDEGERQMVLLALAELSLRRPGWEYAIRELSKKFAGEQLLDAFRQTSKAPHGGILVDYSKPPTASQDA